MIAQSIRYAVAGAGLAAASMGGLHTAEATVTGTRSTTGTTPLVDTGVTPAGTSLVANLNLNVAGCGSDITASDSGQFTNVLSWRCSGGTFNTLTAIGNNDVWFSDLTGLCPFLQVVTNTSATINDL